MAFPSSLTDKFARVLGRVMHQWLHTSRRFARQHGLSVAQIMVLRQLQFGGPCSVSDLAQRMGVTNAAASQILDRLVDQGLVVRRENPADRRSKSVALTSQGDQILASATQWHRAWLETWLGNFSSAEAELLSRALDALDHHLPPAEDFDAVRGR